ncbi:hypothetical protein ABH894_004627 [Paenibacillus sp. RC62]
MLIKNCGKATYFNFNGDRIKEIASAGQELGIELFVLDDGWLSVWVDWEKRLLRQDRSEHRNYNKQTPQREPACCFCRS